MSWYSEDEFKENLKQEIADGSYMDDGAVYITCLHCGTKTCVLSAPCCETREKLFKESSKRVREAMIDRKVIDEDGNFLDPESKEILKPIKHEKENAS